MTRADYFQRNLWTDEKTMREGWRPARPAPVRIAKRVRNRPGMMNEHDIPTDRYNTPRG